MNGLRHTFFLVVDEMETVIYAELFAERHLCEAHIDINGLDGCRVKEVYLDLTAKL